MTSCSWSTTIAYPLILTVTAVFVAAAAAQPASAPAPSPGLDCFPYLMNLTDCLSFVENGSKLHKPDKGCCPALANLVDTQPVCLCQLLGHPDQVGIPIDVSKALKLPSACHVTTPPVSLCAEFGVPVAGLVPAGAPSPGMSTSPSPSGTPPDGISSVPSPSERPSDGGTTSQSPGVSMDNANASLSATSLATSLIEILAALSLTCFF